MVVKKATIFLVCVLALCGIITTNAFVYRSAHSRANNPITVQQTRPVVTKVGTGEADDAKGARMRRGGGKGTETRVRIPRVPSALNRDGVARRVDVILHLFHEERQKVNERTK